MEKQNQTNKSIRMIPDFLNLDTVKDELIKALMEQIKNQELLINTQELLIKKLEKQLAW